MNKEISIRQAFVMILLLVPVMKINMLPSYIANANGIDGYITVIVPMIIELVILWAVIIASRHGGIDKILTRVLGDMGRRFVMLILIIVFAVRALVYSVEVCDFVSQVWFDQHDWLPVVLPLALATVYIGAKGIMGIARSAEIFVWLFIGVVILVALFNSSPVKLQNLSPVMTGNITAKLTSGFKSALWFGDYLPFLMVKIKDADKKKVNLLFLAGGLAIVWTALVYVAFFSVYTSAASEIPNAFFRLLTYVIVSAELGHADWPGDILWLILATIKIAFLLWGIKSASESLSKKRWGAYIYFAVAFIVYAIAATVTKNIQSVYGIGLTVWIPAIVIQYFIPLFVALTGALRCKSETA